MILLPGSKLLLLKLPVAPKPVQGTIMPRYKVDNVQMLKGHYERLTCLEAHLKSTETTIIEVIFPFRVKLNIGTEEVELEFFESGTYTVNISINK